MGNEWEQAKKSYLSRYTGGTKDLYSLDVRVFEEWCDTEGLDPLSVRRSQFELFITWLMTKKDRPNSPRSACRRFQTIQGLFRLAVADDILVKDPTYMVRKPKWQPDRSKVSWLTPHQVNRLLSVAEQTSPWHHVLVALLVTLGLRVSEACNIQIEDIEDDPSGYTVISVKRKGGKVTREAVPIPLLRVIERAAAGRIEGPLILTKAGTQQTRGGAYDWVKRLCRKACLPDNIHPHSLRHTAATTLVNAGVPIYEVQKFLAHADIRTTEWYYHHRSTPDQHGSHVTARVYAASA